MVNRINIWSFLGLTLFDPITYPLDQYPTRRKCRAKYGRDQIPPLALFQGRALVSCFDKFTSSSFNSRHI